MRMGLERLGLNRRSLNRRARLMSFVWMDETEKRNLLLADVLKRSLNRQPLFLIEANTLPGIADLLPEKEGSRAGLLAVSLVSPIEWSGTLYLFCDGAWEPRQQTTDARGEEKTVEERLNWMETREGFRHMLHPAGNRAEEAGARAALLAEIKNALPVDEKSGVLPFITHRDSWGPILAAFANNQDKPRAFGVEKAYFADGSLTSVRDLSGPLNDIYSLPKNPSSNAL